MIKLYEYYELNDYDRFTAITRKCKYKEMDEKEAKEFGYPSIAFLYQNTRTPYQKQYIVRKNSGQILATIVLKRNGMLDYFITEDVKPSVVPTLIKTVRALADETVAKVDVIFVTTWNEYKGANRFVELVGFKKVSSDSEFTTWAYEKR